MLRLCCSFSPYAGLPMLPALPKMLPALPRAPAYAQGSQACLQVLFGVNQRLRIEDVDSPLVSVRPVKNVLLVIVTGDRGLCGGYNNFVLKKVRQR